MGIDWMIKLTNNLIEMHSRIDSDSVSGSGSGSGSGIGSGSGSCIIF
jgi:hypothetical protein